MKKTIYPLILCVGLLSAARAQNFTGYQYNNYQTVGGAIFNPANIANSRYKFDINLFSVNAAGGTNAYSVKRSSLFKMNFNDWEEGKDFTKVNSGGKKNAFTNFDLIGPSLMWSIDQKNSVAVTTRVRGLASERNLDNSVFQLMGNSNPDFFNLNLAQNNLRTNVHGFADIGVTYGRVLVENEHHLLKGGVTAKYVVGFIGGSATADDLDVNMKDEYNFNNIRGNINVLYSKGLDQVSSSNNENISWSNLNKSHGVGFDLGAVYEWRPNGNFADDAENIAWLSKTRSSYKLRASLAVTDIGSVKYALSNNAKSYHLEGSDLSRDDFDMYDNETIDEYLNRLQIKDLLVAQGLPSSYKVKLPTALHANIDWQAVQNFFVNVNADLNLLGRNSYGAGYISSIAVTPRYETRWLGVSMPFSYNTYNNFNWGVGFNVGVFYIGSGSILSNLVKKNIGGADAYAGVHIPIYRPKQKVKEPVAEATPPPKDADGDGITDDVDKCPDVKGVAKYNGCPVPDTDGDVINDEEDKCPNVKGIAKYNGCPVPDTDGDGINDEEDKCPAVKGVARYQGCPVPDTDGDGINDEEDKCPKVPGVAANAGCPEIKQEVVKKIDQSARKVLFATASDKLLNSSFLALDEVVKVLQDNSDVQMNIDGHTDNTGNATLNKALSEKRAASVKKYIVSKGIDESRLHATGYGDTKPIESNKTAAGRAKNRRVEMKLYY